MDHFSHFVIFFLGIFCSICVIFFTKNYSGVDKTKFILPSENFLQVRDDYQVRKFLDSSEQPEAADVVGQKNEALSIVKIAEEFKRDGKEDKALKLFEHAIALAPKHPEILTKYGEFLEHSQRDVVKADQMYFQALIVNPKHDAALQNRRRTANIVDSLDQEILTELDKKRDALSQIHESSAALRRAKKEAYFQHIYHSVGIEGNTMSLSQTRTILETRMAVAGKSIDEHNEILGLDSALKFINASLVNRWEQRGWGLSGGGIDYKHREWVPGVPEFVREMESLLEKQQLFPQKKTVQLDFILRMNSFETENQW